MKPIRLVKGFLTVGLWTFLSRILGFARDIGIAAFLGTGPVAEAFLVAFSLPNLFRRFFAEGAFNMAFVPMFSKKVEAGEDAHAFAGDAFAGLATILIALTLVALAVMPWLVLAMASGFAADERFALATIYGRIAFVYILFISLAALLSGVLNSIGRFAAAAAAPTLLNLTLVAVLVLADRIPDLPGPDQGAERIGTLLSWGVVVAGILQLGLVWWAAAREGYAPRLVRPRMTPDLRRLAIIAFPAVLAGGVVQVNLLVGRQVASFFEGAVAWLSYADRLYQLPLGVIGIAVGVVLLPDLSRRLRAGDTAGGRDAFNRAAELSLSLTIPAAVALVVIPVPLISVLFERGAFGPDDTASTALALAVYGLGLPAFVLQKTLQPLYYAREDTRRPFRYAVVAMVVNAALAIGLAPFIGFLAAAIGTTLASWAMVWQLRAGTREMGEAAEFDARFRRRIWRILAAAAVMGGLLWILAATLQMFLGTPGLRVPTLGGLILAGILAYFGAGQLFGAFRLSEYVRAFRR